MRASAARRLEVASPKEADAVGARIGAEAGRDVVGRASADEPYIEEPRTAEPAGAMLEREDMCLELFKAFGRPLRRTPVIPRCVLRASRSRGECGQTAGPNSSACLAAWTVETDNRPGRSSGRFFLGMAIVGSLSGLTDSRVAGSLEAPPYSDSRLCFYRPCLTPPRPTERAPLAGSRWSSHPARTARVHVDRCAAGASAAIAHAVAQRRRGRSAKSTDGLAAMLDTIVVPSSVARPPGVASTGSSPGPEREHA